MGRPAGNHSPVPKDRYARSHSAARPRQRRWWWPLAPGGDERVDLYQLYPLMVHVNLFGGGYVASVEAALNRIV